MTSSPTRSKENAVSAPVLGIIAEYNPMHDGHIYHLAEARRMSKAAFVVVVMSGDFVQRGEPAILDKWTRSRLAVENGADLVIELPVAWALNSAERFAGGAMAILRKSRVVTHVAFGYDGSDVMIDTPKVLAEAAAVRKSAEYETALREELDKAPYAMAHEAALARFLGEREAKAASLSNNILAIRYLQEMGDMTPVFVARRFDIGRSGEMIRRGYLEGKLTINEMRVPEKTGEALAHAAEKGIIGDPEMMLPFVTGKLLTQEAPELARVYGMTEGLENRFHEKRYAATLKELAENAASKRYTKASIMRILMQTAVGMEKGILGPEDNAVPGYARVLAASREGRKLLRMWKDTEGALPLLTEPKKGTEDPVLALDLRAADVYNAAMGLDLYENADLVRHPYIGD